MDRSFWCALLGIFGIAVFIVTLLFAVLSYGAAVYEHVTWPAPIAQYEQLRRDAAKIDLTASPQVMGQVAEFNRKLAQLKAENQLWFFDPFIADEWMTVEPIEVPVK